MKYRFRDGVSIPGVSADDAAAELERLYEQYGVLRPSTLVEESKPKGAVFHTAFEWRDKQAAHQYRLQQARTLIRAVHVIADDGTRADPVFVHVRAQGEDDGQEGGYHPQSVVVSRPDLFEQAMAELQRHLRSAMNAVESLQRAAEQSQDPDRLARVALAVRALEAASAAINSLH